MLPHTASAGGVEHAGLPSDCSRSILMLYRMVLSRADNFFSSSRMFLTVTRASLVSLMAAGIQPASEQRHPLGWQRRGHFAVQKSPKGTQDVLVSATGRPPGEPAMRDRLRGKHCRPPLPATPTSSAFPPGRCNGDIWVWCSVAALGQQPREKVWPSRHRPAPERPAQTGEHLHSEQF